MSNLPPSVLKSVGYDVVHPANEFAQLSLRGKQFRDHFETDQDAWEFASKDLIERTGWHDATKMVTLPDYQGEAQKLGFEVMGVRGTPPKHGWRNRDLDVCSLRLDYPTETEAWRSAYMWARRFAILWKE